MWVGPRLLSEFTRWRLFAISIVVAGIWLALISLIPNIVLAVIFAALLGAGAGVAWVTGYTLLGLEVADELRGRTFAFVNSAARVVLVAVMAFAPALAALIGERTLLLGEDVELTYNGAAFTLLVASVVAIGIGFLSYRTMDDHMSVPLVADLVNAWQRRHVAAPAHTAGRGHDGFFVAFEGGDGAGKSSQLDRRGRVGARDRPRGRAHPRARRHRARAEDPRRCCCTARRWTRGPRRCCSPPTARTTCRRWSCPR